MAISRSTASGQFQRVGQVDRLDHPAGDQRRCRPAGGAAAAEWRPCRLGLACPHRPDAAAGRSQEWSEPTSPAAARVATLGRSTPRGLTVESFGWKAPRRRNHDARASPALARPRRFGRIACRGRAPRTASVVSSNAEMRDCREPHATDRPKHDRDPCDLLNSIPESRAALPALPDYSVFHGSSVKLASKARHSAHSIDHCQDQIRPTVRAGCTAIVRNPFRPGRHCASTYAR